MNVIVIKCFHTNWWGVRLGGSFSLVYFCISFSPKYYNLQQNLTEYNDRKFT